MKYLILIILATRGPSKIVRPIVRAFAIAVCGLMKTRRRLPVESLTDQAMRKSEFVLNGHIAISTLSVPPLFQDFSWLTRIPTLRAPTNLSGRAQPHTLAAME